MKYAHIILSKLHFAIPLLDLSLSAWALEKLKWTIKAAPAEGQLFTD